MVTVGPKPKPMVTRRIQRALELLAEGHRPGVVSAMIAEKFRVARRTADRDLMNARAVLTQTKIDNPEPIKRKLVEILEAQLEDAREDGDSKSVALLAKTLADVLGLNAPQEHEHHVTGGVLVVGATAATADAWRQSFEPSGESLPAGQPTEEEPTR